MANSYRPVVEVLRFVAPKEVLTTVSELCKLWTKAANGNELWWDLCDLYGILPFPDQPSGKQTFKEESLGLTILELPLVRAQTIVLYSIPDLTETIVQLSSSVNANQFTAYCYLSHKKLMISGGGEEKMDKAYVIGLNTGVVTELASMKQGKRSHALYKHRSFVYAFGGYHYRSERIIEKYSIKGNDWKRLPSQLVRGMDIVMPARYRHSIFLVGILHIQVFHLRSETCEIFPLSLPQDWYYCLTFITEEGEIVIANKDKIISCSVVDSHPTFLTTHIPILADGNYWTNGKPVRCGQAIYSLQNPDGRIEGILKMERYSLSKVRDITH